MMLTLVCLLILRFHLAFASDSFDLDQQIDPFDHHPRLLVKNGHLIFLTGRNKNIIFRSSGTGQIKINGNDILASKLSNLDQSTLDSTAVGESSINQIGRSLNQIEQKIQFRIDQLSNQLNNTKLFWPKAFRQLRYLTKKLNRLERLLKKDECQSNPCQNGGTCEDGFNQYICRCAPEFKGSNCEKDVDECTHYQGTELGCQNGGTCLNTFGGFHCLCPSNYRGVRCTVEFNDCHNVSHHEICGNGLCVNLARTQSDVPRYRCVCYQGFTKSKPELDSSLCDVDVDECQLGTHRCSRNPPVQCINTRDGYSCGPCPLGFSGDGFFCNSVGACSLNNGGCSQSPKVACFDIAGAVRCGSCPSGYVGDGFTCSAVDGDICSSNNGGCSPNADCLSNLAISATYRTCVCRVGYTGNGLGPNGCHQTSSLNCASNPCLNGGYCQNTGYGICICPQGFEGNYCEKPANACASNPCSNNGVCVSMNRGYSCICTKEYTGVNCEQVRSQCGGVLDAEAGVLAYPLSNSTRSNNAYAHNVTCIWLIRNSNQPGKVLNLTFTQFKIEYSFACIFDYLEIFDGSSREYPKIGKFCGSELPKKTGTIVTSFNSVYLHFNSDSTVASEGFELNWITIEPSCGGMILNQTHGLIQSPGYPHHYPANRDCRWQVIADYGKRLQFIFTHLDIKPNLNCSFDYLELREGIAFQGKGNIIARFCNWTSSEEVVVPPPITTSSSFARIHFHSDAGLSSKGFQMVFNQVAGVCGGLLTGSSGIFQSPSTSYTSSVTGRTFLVYENNLACDWTIRVLPEERISLKFLSFALESDTRHSFIPAKQNSSRTSCAFDYVEVYDGQGFDAPLRARLCGRVKPPEIISRGRFMRIKFRSDTSVSLRGFVAKYTALCGGEIEGTEGRFKSPNYPTAVMTSKNCSFLLNAPTDHIIRLEIEEMDIEFDHQCKFDYVQIEGQRYCGQVLPSPIYSMTNEMTIVYVNDESKPSRGFKAKFKAIEIGCGGVMKQDDPKIAISPERMTEQLVINQCLWEIRANPNFIIKVKFYRPETTQTSALNSMLQVLKQECAFKNYIMINDSDGSLIKRFCLDQLPPPITSSGNKLFVTFVFRPLQTSLNQTNVSSTTPPSFDIDSYSKLDFKKAFYANYFFILGKKFCDKNLFKNIGVIRSPRFPKRYPSRRNCTWIIHVDNGLQIRLNFTKFQLEPRSEINALCYDYLEIRNGRRADSPLIGTYCGRGPLPDIVSHSNYLFLRFISDASMGNIGFEVYYEVASTGCGGLLTASSGSIESPGYPEHYFSNLNCEWKIRVSQGSSIELLFVSLDMEQPTSSSHCTSDFLELFDGPDDTAKSLGRFCTNQRAVSIVKSSSNRMFLRFTTDETINHEGFKLNYHTQCNRVLSGRYGVIESPNYPNPHPHNQNCNWHILGPLGNNISLAFTSLILESGVACMFDYINISEVSRPKPFELSQVGRLTLNEPFNLTTIANFCGNHTGNVPPQIKTGKNELVVTFVSDESKSIDSGFRLEWAAEGCGGEFVQRSSGILSSPNYPNPYPHAMECLWHIRAPFGHRVDLVIDTLDLEFSYNCNFDYLQVFAGPDEASPELTKVCSQSSNLRISSLGDSMTIKLVSDLSSSHRGFNGTFSTENQGCGGLFTLDQGVLTSPNYGRGNSYDPKSDCSYKITVQGYFEIELTINDFSIPESVNCSQSYLAIYDSDSETRLIDKLCGDLDKSNKTVIRSKDSVLYLRFKSDGVHNGRGFNITYRRVCGKIITFDDDDTFKVITSTNYPHMDYDDNDCHFILKASNPSDTLSVRFAHIYTPQVSDHQQDACEFTHVSIYEGERDDVKKRVARYCTQTIGPPVVSSGNTLLLVSHFMLFRAYASSIKSFCSGDFSALNGQISNPGYPNSYPLNIECIWTLKAAPGNRYTLKFEDFDIETSEFCNNDYLEIRLNNSSGSLLGGGRLCGSEIIPEIDNDQAGDVWIKFRSDEANVAKGFLLHFEVASTIVLSGRSGQIASPGYPSGLHSGNRTFSWSIVVPPHKFIKLQFLEFALHGDMAYPNACPVQLSIYNGLIDLNQMTPELVQPFTQIRQFALPDPRVYYCGQKLPPTFVSTSNAMTIIYQNNYYSLYPNKFRLEWAAINVTETMAIQGLGIPVDVNSTFKIFIDKGNEFNLIQSNYSDYGNDINWYFETQSSMHLNLSVYSLTFYPSTSCWYNKMTLYVWQIVTQKWDLYKNLCNGFNGQIEVKDYNQFRLHLQHLRVSEGMSMKVSYNISVFPVCGGNFSDPNGNIEVPGDNDAKKSSDCKWLIRVRQGRTIQIVVHFYSIDSSWLENKCENRDSLEIHNGQFSDSPMLSRPLCGHNVSEFSLPETSSNVAYIIYRSTKTDNTFKLSYSEVGIQCGGEWILRSPTDKITISSPGYPNSPEFDIICNWVIRGPLDYGLQVVFKQEKWAPCNEEKSFVDIFDGGTDLSNIVAHRCVPSFNSKTILVNSHISLIRYVLKNPELKSYFQATISVDNCHQEFFIASWTDSAVKYKFPMVVNSGRKVGPQPESCSLRLKSQTNFYISLNVTSIKLRGLNCSVGESIQFKEKGDSVLIDQICAPRDESNTSLNIASLQNELLLTYQRVNYFSNSKLDDFGISFEVESRYRRCYYVIQVERFPQLLTSPHFPRASKGHVYCAWTLVSEPGTRIRLLFNWFDLGSDFLPSNVNSTKCKKKLGLLPNLTPTTWNQHEYNYGCQPAKPKLIESYAHLMKIWLTVEDQLQERQGFSLRYQAFDADNDTCSGFWDEPHQFFTSSHFYETNFSGPVGCAWEMKLNQQNQSGTILLDTFDLQENCSAWPLPLMITQIIPVISWYRYQRQWICFHTPLRPQTTRKKLMIPIIRNHEESVNPTIVLNFNRNETNNFRGIRGEYFIQNCGGIFQDFEGELQSPNYPESYQSDTFCHWHFRTSTSDNLRYRITFTEIQIGENCEDYFEIQSAREPQMKHLICNLGEKPKMLFLEDDMLLSFVSSVNMSLDIPATTKPRGFAKPRKFNFKVERMTHGCGGQLFMKKGFFQSPNYGNMSTSDSTNHQYPPNIECVWHIRSNEDYHLVFDFNDRFDLEESKNCTNDFLLFEERYLEEESNQLVWKQLARLCSHWTPNAVQSNSSEVRITFRTNDKISGDGFYVEYRQECGGLFQQELGVIYSPNYSIRSPYGIQRHCIYQIQRAKNEYIRINFEDLDLDNYMTCRYDYVKLYLGDRTNESTTLYGPYCGNVLPPSLSSRERIDIVFHSYQYSFHRGFKLQYTVTKCGGNYTKANGVIDSPDIVGGEGRSCIWYLTVPNPKEIISMKILHLDLANDHCRHDCCNYLKISNSNDYYSNNYLAYLCSNNREDVVFQSSANEMTVRFYRGYIDSDKPAKFKLIYWSSPGPQQGCGGHISDKTDGVIVSPDIDGDSNYESNLYCVWSIASDSVTQIISLEFERFDVEGNDTDQCDKDYLLVFDGVSLHSQLLIKLCGRNILPDKIISSTGSLLLQFVTDAEGTGHGFRAHFKVENRTCGGLVYTTESKQELTSPGYPHGYQNPQKCTWNFMFGPQYYRIPTILNFLDLNLNCTRGDSVRIIEYSSSSYDTYLYRPIELCSSPGPVKIILNNKVRLDFQTKTSQDITVYDNQNNTNVFPVSKVYRGFKLIHHITFCNDTIDGPDNGIILNRMYPLPDRIYSTYRCYINITVPSDRRISLYFSELTFYQCHYSNLTIYVNGSSMASAILCDMNTPPTPIFTNSNSVSLVIRAQYLSRPPGATLNPHSTRNQVLYRISYSSTLVSKGPPGCGGNFTSLSGTFTSPNYPNPMSETQVCRWLIHASGLHTITLNFDFFLLSPNCAANNLVIYDGEDELEEQKLATFCYNDKPAPIQSNSAALMLKLYTNQENFEPGFQVTYKINTKEPTIRNRVITKETFKFYRDYKVFSDL